MTRLRRPPAHIRGRLTTARHQSWLKTRIKMQRGLCFACGQPLQGDATLDHHIPTSKGGEDCFENTRALHAACNAKKADTLPEAARGLSGKATPPRKDPR
jgi:5-methylcytosine-specific restriction endonuclease McrA